MGLIERMTIWILAFLLLAASAALGHRQGAIRAVITLAGILISALLAWPFSGLIRPLLPHLDVHNPIVIWLLPPLLVFVILLSAFKSVGFMVHRKVEVHHRYKQDELQFLLWQRLNRWLGLCVGLLNGLVYLILVSLVIYVFSYWTVQVASAEGEKWTVRLLNRAGQDLQATGMAGVARAINPLPEIYFKAADFAGLVYQNPQLADRLASYPAFLSLDERDDFKQLGQDADFQGAWKNHSPIDQMLNNQYFVVIWQNEAVRNLVWNIVQSDLDDLQAYLQTGRSAKYDTEPILGRWDVNVVATLEAIVQTRSNVPSSEMAAMRALWFPAYAKTVFVAGADGQAFLKNLPHFKVQPNQPTTFDIATWQGQWKNDGNNYDVTLAGNGANKPASATIDGSRLTLKTDSDTLIFDREE
jgi:uncharacterized membrane protein required for colicin V production